MWVVSAVEVQDGNSFLEKISMEDIGKKNQNSANSWYFEGGKENEL